MSEDTGEDLQRIHDSVRDAAEATDDDQAASDLHEQADAIAEIQDPDAGSGETPDWDRDWVDERREELRSINERTSGDAHEHVSDAIGGLDSISDGAGRK